MHFKQITLLFLLPFAYSFLLSACRPQSTSDHPLFLAVQKVSRTSNNAHYHILFQSQKNYALIHASTKNVVGSYLYCLSVNSKLIYKNDFIPDLERKGSFFVVMNKTEQPIYDTAKKMFVYTLDLQLPTSHFIFTEKMVACRIYTGRFLQPLQASDVMEIPTAAFLKK